MVDKMAEPLPAETVLTPEPPPSPGPVPLPVVPGAQRPALMVSLISVTLPLRASARPCTVTALFIEIEVRAVMLPTKSELVPSVAELPTCQKTLQGWAPL